MKTKFCISIFLIFFNFSLTAQNSYYYYKGKKVSLIKDENYLSKSDTRFKRGGNSKSIQISNIFYVKLHKAGDLSLLQQTVRVKLKDGKKKEDVLKLFTTGEILKTEDKYGILRLSVKRLDKVLEIANKIYEAGIAEFSVPDFYIPHNLYRLQNVII